MTTTKTVLGKLIDNEPREGNEEGGAWPTAGQFKGMTDMGIVRAMQNVDAEIARLEAVRIHGAAALDERRQNPRSVNAELALALCMTEKRAGELVSGARALTRRLPSTLGLLEQGKLSFERAMKVAGVTAWLSDDAALDADRKLAIRLPGKNVTQVRRAAYHAAQTADPDGAERRAKHWRARRRFRLTHQESATAKLSLENAPAEKAIAAYARVDRAARALKNAGGELRTLDQLRADVALDLLLSAEGGAEPRLEVFLYMDFATYTGITSEPVEVPGHGWFPPGLAKEILAGPDTVARRILTDPVTGQVHDLGRTRYRPSAEIAEFVRVRDRECRQPGCSRPARACEIDHSTDWAHGGPTSTDSLLGFCTNNHRLKDEPGWRHQLGEDGTLTITTPAGFAYTSTPPPLHEPRQAKSGGELASEKETPVEGEVASDGESDPATTDDDR